MFYSSFAGFVAVIYTICVLSKYGVGIINIIIFQCHKVLPKFEPDIQMKPN